MSSPKQQAKRYDERIRAEADKALASIPSEQVEIAKALHAKVYAWLDDAASRCSDPGKCVSEALCQAAGVDLEAVRDIARGVWPTGTIVSRMEDDRVWTPTSFFYDADTKALNVKIGDNPYQPFAYNDDEKLVQLVNAKLLWARRWGTSLVAPLAPPFDIVPNKLAAEVFESSACLSELDVKGIDKALQELGEELDSYLTKVTEDPREAEFRLRETLKLCRIWSPTLDAQLKLVLRQKSGLGPNFENADIKDVAKASLEYMAARKDSHLAAVKSASLVLVLSDMDPEKRAQLAYDVAAIRQQLTGEVVVVEVLTNLISRISAAYDVSDATKPLHENGKTPDVFALATSIYNHLCLRLSLSSPVPVGSGDHQQDAAADAAPPVGPGEGGEGPAG